MSNAVRALLVPLSIILLICPQIAHPFAQEAEVERRDLVHHLTFAGDLHAVDSAIIHTPNVHGKFEYVVSYLVPEGTEVRPGELLVEFDTSDLQTKRLELEKKRDEAILKIAQKEAELDAQLQDQLLTAFHPLRHCDMNRLQ